MAFLQAATSRTLAHDHCCQPFIFTRRRCWQTWTRTGPGSPAKTCSRDRRPISSLFRWDSCDHNLCCTGSIPASPQEKITFHSHLYLSILLLGQDYFPPHWKQTAKIILQYTGRKMGLDFGFLFPRFMAALNPQQQIAQYRILGIFPFFLSRIPIFKLLCVCV